MRPLKLIMQAFGPYGQKEEIDFRRLGSRTMFVITGKTGSGKTTIFDGISYAIYGKASGEDRNGPELRSQFANHDLPTEVSLEFYLRGKTYFIKRSPQQEKKKDRGEGYTTIQAKAELYVYDETGKQQLLASNIREVEEKIKEIIIIDSHQFRQILMIPQGEFRKLLISDSKEKEIILQRLFHTEIYKRVEEKLKEESIELKKSVEKEIDHRIRAIHSIHALFEQELVDLKKEGSQNDMLILPLLEKEIGTMNEQLNRYNDEVKEKQQERDKLKQRIFEADIILKQLKAKEELQVKKNELELQEKVFEQKQKDIYFAQKAAVLAQQEELCHRLRKDLDTAERESETIQNYLHTISAQLQKNENILQLELSRATERQEATEKLILLEKMKEDVYSLSIYHEEVQSLTNQIKTTQTKYQKLEHDLKTTEQVIKDLLIVKEAIEKKQIDYLENSQRITQVEYQLEKLIKYEQFYERYQKALQVKNKTKARFQKEEARFMDVRILVEELEQKWINGQASVLASKLRTDEPCPVCGSLDHPHPATDHVTSLPDEQDLKAAKTQLTELEAVKAKAESVFIEAEFNVNSAYLSYNEWLDEMTNLFSCFSHEQWSLLQKEHLDKRERLLYEQEQLSIEKNKLPHVLQSLEKNEWKKEELLVLVEKLKEELQQLNLLYTEKITSYKNMLEQVPEHVRTKENYEKVRKEAAAKKEILEKKLVEAEKAYQISRDQNQSYIAKYETNEKYLLGLKNSLKAEKEAFMNRMREQGFENYTAYSEARKSGEQITKWETEVRQYREEYRSVIDRYKELSNLLNGVEAPELESLQKELLELSAYMEELQSSNNQLFIKKSENEEIFNLIHQINEEIKELENKYALIGHLYEITKGQNTYRLTFERFVLAAFLDDILKEANGRLSKMTNGRYHLIRKTDRSKGNVQSGLELLVFDQYTGQERHVKTLSGGESFKASLSLALGLADVVQEHAGGVSLETMFIDEGFGTLDPESLDQAIETLIDIQSSGRLVGIISHVPELKERMEARLEVTATQVGSRTSFHFINE
ncbi:AAA family ATPase [Bacillus sp. 03113]|uniref:AAA family ATPase n=1 Tax=Bacillus sp. 03113 TaxID=2578211 RepID=UPI001142E8FA|nr:AAA family ATPase [Bacillus sp. 03113]